MKIRIEIPRELKKFDDVVKIDSLSHFQQLFLDMYSGLM